MAGNASATPRGKTVKAPTNGRATPAVTTRQPGAPTEEAIRTRAFQLWEAAGRPEGDGVQFWFQAEHELSANR